MVHIENKAADKHTEKILEFLNIVNKKNFVCVGDTVNKRGASGRDNNIHSPGGALVQFVSKGRKLPRK